MQVAEEGADITAQVLAKMRALPDKRLTRITVQGAPYFVKMAEHHDSLRLRLFKGDPQVAFDREVELLQTFAQRGASVARIIAQDSSRVALQDHGTPVQALIYDHQADPVLMRRLGAALADLHALGLAHGRPSLRDICWDGENVTFLDLEAGAKLNAQPQDQARDLYLMLHSVFTTDGPESVFAAPALDSYRAHGSAQVWTATQALARRLWWIDLVSRPVVWIHRLRHKMRSEFAAIKAARQLILRG